MKISSNATVLQQLAECAEIPSTVKQGRLFYLIDEIWVDVTLMDLGDIIDMIA